LRRLFFTFASGPPGLGLLLIRVLTGSAVVVHSLAMLHGELRIGPLVLTAFFSVLGLSLVLGFWTPLAAGLIALSALWDGLAHPAARYYALVVGVLGVALALLGPGAWSVDARLFGWRRV
jgi:putative oxidoreductase